MPKALETKINLDNRQAFYYDIFVELSSSRGRDEFGAFPITASELLSYCTFYGINDIEQRTVIAKHIRALDSAFLERLASKKDKEVKT